MDIYNGYRINNPDGVLNENFDEWQKPFTGGGNSYVNEASSISQSETSGPDEIYDPDKKRSDNNTADDANASQSGPSRDVRSSANARSLNALSATSTLGGGLGAFAGVIASSFVTAALVVAVFVSVLTIRLSLVMADVDRLIVQVTMEGAQDEDFLTPIVAVLEGKNGEHREVDILRDTHLLTFDGLSPDEEYTIRVRSGEKLFAENSFVTASKRRESGSITAYTEGNKVYIVAKDVALKAGEFYSVVAGNGAGKTLFSIDSDEPNKTFSFTLDDPTDLYITLGIGGEVYSVCQIKMESVSVYDLGNGTWEWTDNNSAAVSFDEINGGTPLVISADVVERTTLQPGCETVGVITFTATAEYKGVVYSDVKTATIPAVGHEYGEPKFTWTATSDGYGVTAEFICAHDASHKEIVNAEVKTVMTDPTCEKDGSAAYTATVVFGGKEYSDKKAEIKEKSALGHEYGEPTFTWTETSDGYGVTAEFICAHDASHKKIVNAEVKTVMTDPTCDKDGYVTYTAAVVFGGEEYSDKKVEIKEKSALGHEYGEPTFTWIETSDGYIVTAEFICVHDVSHKESASAYVYAAVTEPTSENDGYVTYTATVFFDDKEYSDEKVVVNENSALGHEYGEPTFTWTETNDGYSVTAEFVSKNDESQKEIVNAEVKTVVTDPTCENDGYVTYTAAVVFGGKEYSDKKVVVDEETSLGHEYGEPTFTWTATGNGYSVTAEFVCTHDANHKETVNADIWAEESDPTCEEDGYVTYTATVVFDDEEYSDEKVVVDEESALGHDYGDPTFTWTATNDGYSVTAEFVCSHNENHKENVNASVASVDTDPTCEDDGFTTYTATAVFDDKEYSDEKVVVDEESALGHDFSQYYENSEYRPTFVWTADSDGGYTAAAVFYCKNNSSHTKEIEAEIGVEDGVDCSDGGYIYYYASVLFNDCNYSEEKKVWAEPGHKLMPVFHWIIGEETFTVEFYMICERGDYHTDPISVDLVTTEEDGYTLYTATAVYEDVEYTESKTVVKNTEKPLEIGATFRIGDTIDLNGTVYFSDDYTGAKRTSMSGPTPIVGVGSESGTQTSYDALILQNDQFVRMDENGWAAGETPEWLFISGSSDIVGVTISGGSGTAEDPYTLTPVYGVTVTYNANDGVFNTIDGYSVTQYYTDQEVSSGVYAVPIAENPESSGKLFIGWFTDEYATKKFDFENTPITESIMLYAGWVSI